MGRWFGLVAGMMAVLAVGCHHSKKKELRAPHIEEFNPPPEEARYNNPPEDRYRKRPEIKDQAAQRPSAGMGGGMGGAPGGFQ
jgi:hypothetical protein